MLGSPRGRETFGRRSRPESSMKERASMSSRTPTIERPAVRAETPELKRGALKLIDTVVIAVSSTAPAYSVATAIGALALAVALAAPAAVWVRFLPLPGGGRRGRQRRALVCLRDVHGHGWHPRRCPIPVRPARARVLHRSRLRHPRLLPWWRVHLFFELALTAHLRFGRCAGRRRGDLGILLLGLGHRRQSQ